MKATTLLEWQHRSIERLCDAIEQGSPSVRESLLPQLANDLDAHLAIEEELFYPAARGASPVPEPVDECCRQAQHARAILDELLDVSPRELGFEERVAELRTILAEHVAREEERLFPAVERGLSAAENRALGERMLSAHTASVERGYEPLRSSSSREIVTTLHAPSSATTGTSVASS